jgi:hypothetical protein
MKALILTPGRVDLVTKHIHGWRFDLLGIVPLCEVKSGMTYIAGYTIEELYSISISHQN